MPFPKGSITDNRLYSKELDENIPFLVYLPASFSPLKKYDLLIAQDGRDYFQFGRIGRVADELIYHNEMDDVIIIGVPYVDVQDRRKKYHPDGSQNKAYIRFLAHELVPFLDEQYPTYQMGGGRALIGDSLAATVSLMTALQYPHTFGKVILQSPLINERVLELLENFDQPHLISIYHTIGIEETEVKTTNKSIEDFLAPNREANVIIESKAFPYFYEEIEGNHSWKFWQPDLKRILMKMFSV